MWNAISNSFFSFFLLMSSIKQAHIQLKDHALISFPLKLSHQYNKDNKLKKAVKSPQKFPEFNLDSPRDFDGKNALGLLCGSANGIIVIDVDLKILLTAFFNDIYFVM